MSEPSDFRGSEAEAESHDADIKDVSSPENEIAGLGEFGIREPSRKRVKGRPPTHEGPWTRSGRWERLLPFYNDKYVDLLKKEGRSEEPLPDEGGIESFGPSQYGTVQWDPREKAAFFSALSRKGRHDVKAIADAIGTKSEVEVFAYLNLLRDRAADQHLYKGDARAPALAQIPAATEVSEETEAMLDRHAEALSLYQDNVDILIAKRRHPDTWLIDMEKARSLDETVESIEDLNDDTELPVPEAELFRLKAWVELSQNVFMNSGIPRYEDNWRNITFEGETPAIALDAVKEFHELVLSLTRRLMQTSIILAESRIRATTSATVEPRPIVREQDVSAALDILKLPQNSWNFWHKAPRRCLLSLSYTNQSKEKRAEMDYDEIERLLYEKTFRSRGRSSSVSTDTTRTSSNANNVSSEHIADDAASDTDEGGREPIGEQGQSSYEAMDDDDYDGGDSSGVEDLDIDMEQQLSNATEESEGDSLEDYLHYRKYSTNREIRRMRLEQQHHSYAEQVDQADGQAEEIRLWKILGRKIPTNISGARTAPSDRGPISLRKSRHDLLDWTDTIIGRRGWEEYAQGDRKDRSSPAAAKRQRRSTGEDNAPSSMDLGSETWL